MLTNQANECQLGCLGYTISPLLSPTDIKALRLLYEETESICGLQKGFYTSIWSSNEEYRSRVDMGLKKILVPRLDGILQAYSTVFANFMVKHAGTGTQLAPHQDWSFADEPRFGSLTIWIPLTDVTERNGALSVLPGSHRLTNYVRPRFANSPFISDIESISDSLMQSISLKAGEALVMNSRCVHSSPLNQSDRTRLAVSIVAIPKESEIVHHILDPDQPDTAYRHVVDSGYFQRYSCFDYPPNFREGSPMRFEPDSVCLDDLLRLRKNALFQYATAL